ncbi:MAG: 16S rRNA (adenine(1518)-N(6)/adenine(1519)-N(6))-dimethyltransferase RsmA [Clostridia bacterium]|nr:16S rRNA (adenine(1518)-N(6)/adenine(1519)-N(6))-dimethyltransferase RsmA [Clostridia bacterium]
MNLCDLREIKQIMQMFSLNFKKEFGQNFLTDNMVVEDIADMCCDFTAKTVLEIGPGIGSLTQELAKRYENVVAFEIDKGLIPVLKYTLGSYPNVKVINEDIMEADLKTVLAPYFEKGGVSVCANLPYYITTPILMKLLESGLPFDYITVMVQKEVADRLCAKTGGKDCGAITSVLAYYGSAEMLFRVNADRFVPPPKVDSAVMRIKLYREGERPYHPKSVDMLFRTIKAAFEQRRKTLPNSLSASFSELDKATLTGIVTSLGHSENIRGEKLTIEEFVALSDRLFEEINKKDA